MKKLLLITPIFLMLLTYGQTQVNWIDTSTQRLKYLDAELQASDPQLIPIRNELGFRSYFDRQLFQAFNYALSASQLAIEYGNQDGLSDSWVVLGHVARVEGNLKQAEKYYQEATAIRKKQADHSGVCSTLNSLGVLSVEEGDYQKGLAYFKEALMYFDQIASPADGDRTLATYVYTNMGDLYCKLGNHEAASRAFASARQMIPPDQRGYLNIDEGTCLLKLKLYESSKGKYMEALDLFQRALDSVGIAKVYFQLMVNNFEEQQYQEALEYAEQAAVLNAFLDETEKNLLIKNKGSIYKSTGQHQLAMEHYNRALVAFQQMGNEVEMAKLHFDIGNIHYERKAYSDAIDNYEEALASLRNHSMPELKDQIKLVLDAAREKQKLIQSRYLILAGLLAAIIIAVLILFSSYQKRQLAQSKVQRTELRLSNALQELRLERSIDQLEDSDRLLTQIAKELHDRLGSMLSTIKLYFDDLNQRLTHIEAENKGQLQKANTLLDEVCEEVRRISRGALPANLPDRGLVKEIEYLTEHIKSTHQLDVEFTTYEMDKRLEIRLERHLYRMLFIVIDNILRYSKATWFSVQINRFEEELNIMVEDNGIGFDVDKVSAKGGGLQTLHQLGAELGAIIAFDNKKGTSVAIDIPFLTSSEEDSIPPSPNNLKMQS